MKKFRWMSILAAIMLPVTALAGGTIEENTAVALPTLEPAPQIHIVETDSEYKIDLEAYYAEDGWGYQTPALTETEKERLAAVQAEYDSGVRPSKSVLNTLENVELGVYDLPADQYQGESVFVILPNRELTDDELLMIVDAYAALGRAFDPEQISWRNCMRGGSIECTRSLAGDERERYSALRDLYQRQQVAPQGTFTALPCDDGIGCITLNADAFNGMTEFSLWPARRMTDEELLQYAAMTIGAQKASAAEYGEWETKLRTQMNSLVGMPLSAKRTGEDLGNEKNFAIYGADRGLYTAYFNPIGESDCEAWQGYLALEDGTLACAYIFYDVWGPKHDVLCDPFDEKWLNIAEEWVKTNRTAAMSIAKVISWGETQMNVNPCADISVYMEDGSSYAFLISFTTEKPVSIEYKDAVRTANEDAYYLLPMMEGNR